MRTGVTLMYARAGTGLGGQVVLGDAAEAGGCSGVVQDLIGFGVDGRGTLNHQPLDVRHGAAGFQQQADVGVVADVAQA